MDAEEFDGWFLYFKYIQEESSKPAKGKGKPKKGNDSTTVYY